MADDIVRFELSRAEALVMFEWLKRTDAVDALQFEDPSEQRVLWKMEGHLERLLHEPFAENYGSLLDEARRKVREGD